MSTGDTTLRLLPCDAVRQTVGESARGLLSPVPDPAAGRGAMGRNDGVQDNPGLHHPRARFENARKFYERGHSAPYRGKYVGFFPFQCLMIADTLTGIWLLLMALSSGSFLTPKLEATMQLIKLLGPYI